MEDPDKMIESTMNEFYKQFGNMDEHTKLVLETIFEICYGEKDDLPVSGKARQERSQNPRNL
jgi:hypothetical protein